jgi:hypothetical protein
MALIVEDGTGRFDANSYTSIADADVHHLSLGHADWTALTVEQKEIYLLRAMAALRGLYRSRWVGMKRTASQALDWPRFGVTVDGYTVRYDEIPQEVRAAQAELALKAASQDLMPDEEQRILNQQVGSLSITYDPHSPQAVKFRAIDAMLAPYLAGSGNTISLRRV